MKKMKSLFMMFVLMGTVAFMAVPFTGCGGEDPCTYEDDPDCFCEANPDDPRCAYEDCTYERDPVCYCEANPDDERCTEIEPSIPEWTGTWEDVKAGSNFYIFSMDEASAEELGDKVVIGSLLNPGMENPIDIWDLTLMPGTSQGVNAWGQPVDYIVFITTDASNWAGGGMVAPLSEYWGAEDKPDLRPLMEDGYYFHFAIKSPSSQPNAAWEINLWSQVEGAADTATTSSEVKYVVGPNEYAHDGEWHHFEIPVSELKANGYYWRSTTADYKARYLLSFAYAGTDKGGGEFVPMLELNLDAIFFYKK